MICKVCGENRIYLQCHHLYSQTKQAKKLYGNLIHDRRNILMVCENCHMTKPIPKFTEEEFCNAIGIKPRSKTAKFKEAIRQKSSHE